MNKYLKVDKTWNLKKVDVEWIDRNVKAISYCNIGSRTITKTKMFSSLNKSWNVSFFFQNYRS